MNKIINASRIRWAVLVLIYIVFHVWYGGNGRPLTEEEVERYVDLTTKRLGPQATQMFREFASNDDGKEFVMVNLNKYREKPVYRDGREVDPGLTSQEVEQKYIANIVGNLFARASHPLVGVAPFVSMRGEGDFERTYWGRVNLVRYRSRRDFLEFILETEWNTDVSHKWAALERTHSLPSTPQINLVSVRSFLFLLLVCIGLLLDRIFSRRASA